MVALRFRYAHVPANIERQDLIIEKQLGAAIDGCKEKINAYLEVDDNEDDNDSGDQIRDIGRVLPIEGLLQCENLVLLSQEEVEKGNDCTFELSSLLGTDGDW